jgi:hypothetical protein
MGRTRQDQYRLAIAVLRHAKLVRTLTRRLMGAGVPVMAMTARAQVKAASAQRPSDVGDQSIEVFVPDGSDEKVFQQSCDSLLRHPPLSKFGVRASARIKPASAWRRPTKSDRWSVISLEATTFLPQNLNGQRIKPSLDRPPLLIDLGASDLEQTVRSLQELGATSR